MLEEKSFSLEDLFSEFNTVNPIDNTNMRLFEKNSPEVMRSVESKLIEVKNFLEGKEDNRALGIIKLQKAYKTMREEFASAGLNAKISLEQENQFQQAHQIFEKDGKKSKSKEKLSFLVRRFFDYEYKKLANTILQKKLEKKKKIYQGMFLVSLFGIGVSFLMPVLALFLILCLSLVLSSVSMFKKKNIDEKFLEILSDEQRKSAELQASLTEYLELFEIKDISEFRYLAQKMFLDQNEKIEFAKEAINNDQVFNTFSPLNLFSEKGIMHFVQIYENYEKRKEKAEKDIFKSNALDLLKVMNG